jgi:hypothetical protein
MEPRQFEKPVESRGEGLTSPPHQPEHKRRFRIVKLEERIAPSQGGNGTNNNCLGHTFLCGGRTFCCFTTK